MNFSRFFKQSLRSKKRTPTDRTHKRLGFRRLLSEQLESRTVFAAGTVEFASATTLVNEQAGYRTIDVVRVGGSDGSLSVNFATIDGAATTADGDYIATAGTLVFANGEIQKVITVQVANAGTVAEGSEKFSLNLTGGPGVVGPNATTEFTINDTPTITMTVSVTAASWAAGVATITTSTDHRFSVGHLVSISGITPAAFNNTNAVITSVTANTFTYLIGAAPTNYVSGGNVSAATTTTIGTATPAIPFTVGDAETAAGSLTLSATSSNPQLVPISNIVFGGSGASRTVTVTPAAGLSGSSRIYIIASDANGAEITANFTLQVGNATAGSALAITSSTPANSIPNVVLGSDDSFTLNYTTASSGWVTNVTFVEHDNANLIGAHGTGSTSDLRTQPATSGATARTLRIRGRDNSTRVGEYGTASVTLGFTGSGAPTNTHTFGVRVNPRAGADNNLLGIPGTTNTFDVLSNDANPLPGHTFNITGVSGATNGTLSIAPNGKTLLYTPTNLTTGIDRFTYTVTVNSSDAFNGYSFTGQAYVKIGGYVVIDSPTASQHTDLDFDFVGGEWIQRIRTDASITGSVESGTFGPSIHDADEGVIFFDPSTKQPRSAAPSMDVLGVPAGADVWYGPTTGSPNKIYLGIANESTQGVDAYTPVGDPRAATSANWVATKLVGFSGPGNFAAFNGANVSFDTFDGLNSPTDAASGGNVSDTFWGFAGSHAHPAWYFTAAGRYELTFETTVRVGGQFVTSPPTTFTFDVDRMGGNARLRENPPTLKNDAITITEDSGAATINVLANDNSNPDGFERLRITATSATAIGTIAVASDGLSLSYVPAPNFAGIDSFTYTVTDEHGGVAIATVTVTVTPVNDAPVATVDAYTAHPGSTLRGNVLTNDSDVDDEPLTAVLVSTTSNGTLVLNGNGAFEYIPGSTFSGTDSFTYRASDGEMESVTTTVTITGSIRPEFEAVLRAGHVDIGVNFDEGAWDLHIHDEETDTEYEPNEAMLYVGRDAMLTRNGAAANPAYDFLGVPSGSSLFVLPQTQNTNLLFLGVGAEDLADGLLEGDIATLRLASVSGPGQFSIWQSGLTPTTPNLIMATSDGIDAADAFEVNAGSHTHMNFAFTKMGFYEVTFVASGIDAEGNATDSGQVTYYFQVGNTVDALDVQNGQVQRSFVRNVDLVFGEEDNMADLLATGRISVTKFDLNGENGVAMAASAWSASTVGNRLRMDFGVQGIGGNRNDSTADGYYRVGIDIDSDGTADAYKHFYRLLGDVNGDRQVNALDRLLVMRGNSPASPSVDVNGDGVVNAVDLTLVTRSLGKKLKNGLWVDD